MSHNGGGRGLLKFSRFSYCQSIAFFSKWGAETYTLLHKLWLEGGYGICFVPCFNLFADAKNYRKPSWSDAVFSFRVLDEEYLKFLSDLYNTKFE